jgi:hypothetical protein
MFDRYLDQFRLALYIALLCGVVGCIWYFYDWAYDRGEEHTQIAWDKEKAELTTAALKASEAARLKEKSLNLSVERVSRDYQKLQAAHALATADLERVQRDFEAALNSRCAENPSATGCANGTGGLEQELLRHCATNLIGLSKAADRLAAKVVSLQDYIKSTQ